MYTRRVERSIYKMLIVCLQIEIAYYLPVFNRVIIHYKMDNNWRYGENSSRSSNYNRGPRQDDRHRRNYYSNRGQNNSFEEKSDQITIHIDSAKVGKLIGKSGSNIRDLESKTSTKIRVSVIVIMLFLHICKPICLIPTLDCYRLIEEWETILLPLL